MTNPETGAGYDKQFLVEDGYYALYNAYGWPGPDTQSSYGSLEWTNAGTRYRGDLSPFYLLPTGRINSSSASGTGAIWGPGTVGQWWSGAAKTVLGEQVSFYNGINNGAKTITPSRMWQRRNTFSLRCLTQ